MKRDSQAERRQAHNLKSGGSIPPPAICWLAKFDIGRGWVYNGSCQTLYLQAIFLFTWLAQKLNNLWAKGPGISTYHKQAEKVAWGMAFDSVKYRAFCYVWGVKSEKGRME